MEALHRLGSGHAALRAMVVGLVALGSMAASTHPAAHHGVVARHVGPASPRVASVAFYGDSLLEQAGPYVTTDFNLTDTRIDLQALGGLPLCSWLPSIGRLTASTAPTVAVIESAGDIFAKCMDGYVEPDTAFLAKYRADLTTAIDELLHVGTAHVIVTAGPVTSGTQSPRQLAFRKLFRSVVAGFKSPDVVYGSTISRAVETAAGAFATYLPCLRVEIDAGNCPGTKAGRHRIQVRSPDGTHFCPVNSGNSLGQIALCPVYSSGAYRYAAAIAALVWHAVPRTKPPVLPIVSSITPHVGSVKGGNTVYVTGTRLSRVRSVEFKAVNDGVLGWTQLASSRDVTVLSGTRLRIVVPSLYAAPTPGVTVYVSVRTRDAQSFWDPIVALSYAEH